MAEPVSGTLQLRPLRVGEMLDRAFRIYRQRFWRLIVITLIAMIPKMVVLGLLGIVVLPDIFPTTPVFSSFFFGIIDLLLTLIVEVVLIAAIASIYLEQPASTGRTFVTGLRRYFSVLSANVIFIVVVATTIFLLWIVGNPIAIASIFLFALPLAAFLGIRWALAAPAIVLENNRAIAGLERSWMLTRENFWRVFGTTIAVRTLIYFVATIPTTFFRMIAIIMETSQQSHIFFSILDYLTSYGSEILTLPFSICVTVLIYYDLRIRKEGFDLEYMAQQVETQRGETDEQTSDNPAA
jgi:hypothetical protein